MKVILNKKELISNEKQYFYSNIESNVSSIEICKYILDEYNLLVNLHKKQTILHINIVYQCVVIGFNLETKKTSHQLMEYSNLFETTIKTNKRKIKNLNDYLNWLIAETVNAINSYSTIFKNTIFKKTNCNILQIKSNIFLD